MLSQLCYLNEILDLEMNEWNLNVTKYLNLKMNFKFKLDKIKGYGYSFL